MCFQAMHVVLSMQHLGKGDADARITYSASTKFHPLRVEVFPTPANYLELAGINVYVPVNAIRIAITIMTTITITMYCSNPPHHFEVSQLAVATTTRM